MTTLADITPIEPNAFNGDDPHPLMMKQWDLYLEDIGRINAADECRIAVTGTRRSALS